MRNHRICKYKYWVENDIFCYNLFWILPRKRAGIWKYFQLGIFYLIFILHTYTYTITVLWPQQTNLEVLPLPLGYNNNHTIVFGVWTIGRLPNRLEGIDHLFKKNAQLLFKILTSRLTPRFELLLWRSRPGYTYIYTDRSSPSL